LKEEPQPHTPKRRAISAGVLSLLILAGAVALPRLFNREYQAGETAELGGWLIKVTGLEATATLTSTIAGIERPRAGNFWLLHLELHTDRDNTLEGFQWAVVSTQGRTGNPFGAGLYQVYRGDYTPLSSGIEWLAPPTTLNCLLIFDLPEKTPPSWLVLDRSSGHPKLKLSPPQPTTPP
jgi:hypothetical protein